MPAARVRRVTCLGVLLTRPSRIPCRPGALDSANDRCAAIAQQLKSMPIWIFPGAPDESVSVVGSRHMAAAPRAPSAYGH
jgi:hypothetical protein